MSGHRKPKQSAPTVAHDDERKEELESQGLDYKEIYRRNRVRMIAEEGPQFCRAPSLFDPVIPTSGLTSDPPSY